MGVFLSLLPIYIFGNLHCISMCGPLVLMLGRHRFRNYYFFGRMLSFSMAGLLAGATGAVLHSYFQQYHISAFVSFFFGSVILGVGFLSLLGLKLPLNLASTTFLKSLNRRLSVLILMDRPLPVFLFGFFTLALPCGQTVIVYSALALEGNLWSGLTNGILFSLFTSPSLFVAMRAQNFFKQSQRYYQTIFGFCALLIGTAGLCRAFAEAGVIPHLVLHLGNQEFHIAFF